MKCKILAGVVVIFGLGLVSTVTPYPKEVFAITTGTMCIIIGLVYLLEN